MTLEFAGNMLCSAGVSYFHVYPNGDVYRCLADYNARRPPMFNLKRDGWKGAVNPTVCDHERCYNACDLDWTTKWQVDGQGRLEKTFEGQRQDTEKEIAQFLCSQRLESPQRRIAYFTWSPTLACNYTCAYCGCAAGEKPIRNDFPSSYPELTSTNGSTSGAASWSASSTGFSASPAASRCSARRPSPCSAR